MSVAQGKSERRGAGSPKVSRLSPIGIRVGAESYLRSATTTNSPGSAQGKTKTSHSRTIPGALVTTNAYTAALADTVTVSDSVALAWGTSVALADTVTASDSGTAINGNQLPLTDTVTVTDAQIVSLGQTVSLADTVTVTDALLPSVATSTALADTVTVSDAVSPLAGQGVGLADTIAVSDQTDVVSHANVGLADTIAVTDLLGNQTAYQAPAADTVTVADAVDLAASGSSGFADTVTVADQAVAQMAFNVSLADTVAVSDQVSFGFVANLLLAETVTVTDGVSIIEAETGALADTITLADAVSVVVHSAVQVQDTVAVSDTVALASLVPVSTGGTSVQVSFPDPLRADNITDLARYTLIAEDGGVPLGALDAQPVFTDLASGNDARIIPAPGQVTSIYLQLPGQALDASAVGGYVMLDGYPPLQIVDVPFADTVQVDRPLFVLVPDNGSLAWKRTTAVTSVVLTTNLSTRGKTYRLEIEGLRRAGGLPYEGQATFVSNADRPRIASIELLPEGTLKVTFSTAMRHDTFLTSPDEYSLDGGAQVVGVQPLSPTQVLLRTLGLNASSFHLTVNATGTPHDEAGNPIDPGFNTLAFTGAEPEASRSIFVNRGPITKPPLTLATGTGVTFLDPATLIFTGGSFSSNVVGKYLTLGSNATNGGTYLITAWLSPTKLRVKASFHRPDSAQSTTSWEVFDPRDGEIADDPSDVVVRINNVPVVPDAVVGLLGQVLLPSAPGPADDVKVDYSFLSNPTVEIRRLNSKEFHFNAWNRDVGATHGRHYRYNNVLTRPSDYQALDLRAKLPQPLQRDLKYRGYERAYSALLNDPNLLVFNSPLHKIAYAPLERPLQPTFVSYAPVALPEDASSPWTRVGEGTAALVLDRLVVGDTTGGPFPGGNPIFWTRPIDLTFPHVYAMTWQCQVNTVTTSEGVWTGIAAGFTDDQRAIVVGFLLDGGVRKVGILRRDHGNDPGDIASWAGASGSPVALDWSVLHSFRIFQADGLVRVYFDGNIVDDLRLPESELPFLEELDDPFTSLQTSFFGSLSRPAVSLSTWDFVRYQILPSSPTQTAPSLFVSYEGNVLPEDAAAPWTLVGAHGTERVVSSTSLQVDSTSATDAATETSVGLIGGDYRAFARLEPLLASSANVILDVGLQVLTHTHGICPNAITAAIDDGTRLLQLSFFPDKPSPKMSYGGRSLPGDFEPTPWLSTGTADASMVGRILRITDSSTTDGRVFYRDDTASPGADDRIVAAGTDYIMEFRCAVLSHTADVGGFAGVMGEVYDGTRVLGLVLLDVAGVTYVAPQSDGSLLPGPVQWAFAWNDGAMHTYRLVKTGGSVTAFADGQLLGVLNYTDFSSVPGPVTGTVSWGSSTVASMGARSIVDWAYANTWRVVSGVRTYAGFWKGTDPDSLTGYHLPVKLVGRGAVAVGNTLQDSAVDFVASGLVSGDKIIVDVGANKGVYDIVSVATHALTLVHQWPAQPSLISYRIPRQVDWTVAHKYRMSRTPSGAVALTLDADTVPLITIGYNEVDLPPSSVGVPTLIAGGYPIITWGALDPTQLSSTLWDFVRYGITRSPTELRIAPHHQVLNQRNVMASPEHLRTNIVHPHTDYWSSDTGIPPQVDPDLLQNPLLIATTLLNEGTPLVPRTQSTDVQVPVPLTQYISSFNTPEDVLNSDGDFTLNDGALRHILHVEDDVLYSNLEVIETTTGETDKLTPFCDCGGPEWGTFSWTKEVCLTYDGATLPEASGNSPSWSLVSDVPANVSATPFAGVLTYGTTGATRTVYRNPTALPDSLSLTTEVTIRMKVLQDSSLGLGDSQVRLGFSSSAGFTLSLAFVTTPLGERYVLLVDQNSLGVVGGIPFDWYDGQFHTYRMVRDPGTASVLVFVDS